MVDRNADMPEGRRIRYHVGVNAGDVIEEPEDIYGDSVNLAARLATLAEGGAICVSEIVYEEVRHRVQYDFEDIGEHFVKNIARAVRVFTLYPGTIARLPTSLLPLSLAPPRTPPRLSIVVLPFINLSNDLDQQYLADGIT
jgi:class 3 adenylate cyclase